MTTFIHSQLNTEYLRLAAEEGLIEKTATLTVVAGNNSVDLPDDWQRTLQIVEDGKPLRPVTALEYADINTTGGPRRVYFPQSPERILVTPAPTTSEAQGITIIYVARPTALSGDADIPSALPLEYHDILVELVLIRAFLAEEQLELSQSAQVNAQVLLERLRAHTRMSGGDGIGKMILPPLQARYGRRWS
jgi:hypothetical protein